MKVLLIILGVMVGLVICIMPISGLMARQGLKNRGKSWAPGMVFKAARIRMILFQHRSARKIMERGLQAFPKYKRRDLVSFRIGYCWEKTRNYAEAATAYRKFVEQWPKHPLADQAQRRIADIEAKKL